MTETSALRWSLIPTTLSDRIVIQAAVVMSKPTSFKLPNFVELASFYWLFMDGRTYIDVKA